MANQKQVEALPILPVVEDDDDVIIAAFKRAEETMRKMGQQEESNQDKHIATAAEMSKQIAEIVAKEKEKFCAKFDIKAKSDYFGFGLTPLPHNNFSDITVYDVKRMGGHLLYQINPEGIVPKYVKASELGVKAVNYYNGDVIYPFYCRRLRDRLTINSFRVKVDEFLENPCSFVGTIFAIILLIADITAMIMYIKQ